MNVLGLSSSSTPHEALDELAARFPRPTNAVAIAALNTFHEYMDADAAVKAGENALVARSFMNPLGILPRMRMLAFGRVNQGDRFKDPTDKAWWARPYAHPLWAPLGTYLDKRSDSPVVHWDEQAALGSPVAISQLLTGVQDDVAVIQAAKAEGCAPFFIPRARGVMPVPNPVCLARLGVDKSVDPRKLLPRLALPWWVWLATGYIVLRVTDRR